MFRKSRLMLLLVSLGAAICCLAMSATCQAGADPVKDFYQRLAATKPPVPPTPEYRENWKRYINARLRNASLLARACGDGKLVSAHPIVFEDLRAILKKEIANIVVNSPHVQSKRAAAVLIAELGNSKSKLTKLFARAELFPFLDQLAGSNEDASVRASAIISMGKMLPISLTFLRNNPFPDIHPPAVIKTDQPNYGVAFVGLLAGKLRSKNVEEARLSAEALHNIMRQINVSWNPTSLDKYLLVEQNDSLNTAPGILAATQAGLSSGDDVVRLNSLEAIDQGCLFAARSSLPFPKMAETWSGMLRSQPFKRGLISDDVKIRVMSLIVLEKIADLYTVRTRRANVIPPPKKIPMPPISRIRTRRSKIQLAALQVPANGPAKSLLAALQDSAKIAAQSLHHPNVRVRLQAIDFLEAMADFPQSAEVVNALTARIHDRDMFVRWAAARTLGQIGLMRLRELKNPDAETLNVIQSVVRGLASLTDPRKEQDRDVRLYAAKSLYEIALGAKSATPPNPTVVKIIMDNSARHLAACATPPNFDPPIPAYVRKRQVVTADQGPRAAALYALSAVVGGIGRDDETARWVTAEITSSLRSAKPLVRKVGADTLGSFGRAAEAAVPALQELLQDPVPEVRLAASEAILSIQSPAPPKEMPKLGG